MSCLSSKHCANRWIGLRIDCEGLIPLTGHYLEDFPGLSQSEASKKQGPEHVDPVKIKQLQLGRAWDRMKRDFLTTLSKRKRANFQSYQAQATIGAFEGEWMESEQIEHRGIRIHKDDVCGGVSLIVRGISFRVQDCTTVELKISDGVDSLTETFQLTAGERYCYELNWIVKSEDTYITISGAVFEDTDIYDDCFYHCCNRSDLDRYFTAYSYNPDNGNTSCSASGSGVSLDVVAGCDEDALFCPYYKQLGRALWYAAAMEAFTDALFTDRLNGQTAHKDMLDEHIKRIEVDYQKEISKAVDNLGTYFVKELYNCFECNQFRIRHVTM